MLNVMSHAAAAGQAAAKAGLNVDLIVNTVVQSLIFVGIGVVVFHFLRHFPAMVGWLPAHTPKLALVDPPVQPEMETQDRVEAEDGGKT